MKALVGVLLALVVAGCGDRGTTPRTAAPPTTSAPSPVPPPTPSEPPGLTLVGGGPTGLSLPLAPPRELTDFIELGTSPDACLLHARVQNGRLGFARDSAAISRQGRDLLVDLAEYAVGSGAVHGVLVEGFASDEPTSTDAHDLELSVRRASGVANVIRPVVGERARLTVAGRGVKDPVASNDTEAGRVRNRRVDITFTFARCA